MARLPPSLRGADTASRVNAYKAGLFRFSRVHIRDICSRASLYGARRHTEGKMREDGKKTKTYCSLIARRDFTTRRRRRGRAGGASQIFSSLVRRYRAEASEADARSQTHPG